jgi:hypothetical protein
MECRGEEGVVFMGVAFRELPGGRSGGDYPSRAIVKCSGAPSADTAFMGLTSCRWITIARTLARRQRVAQRHYAVRRVTVERAADRYTLICDAPSISSNKLCIPNGSITTAAPAGPNRATMSPRWRPTTAALPNTTKPFEA